MSYTKGQRVITPEGIGSVSYCRFDSKTFIKVISVSVVLDSKKNTIGYTGTIYPVTDIKIQE